ncbi:glycosyltransferase, partial [Roseococcus sp. DSY-14]|uniref:glycosyltransferase n=1 Tax=Roseococcus sp. DSY-14 TaxID=3369650 RepID=UPI00387B5D5C
MLLAALDGAAFLPAQLDSLAAQQGAEWRLLWRDDGSSDGTAALLEGFAARHPGRVARLDGPARLGATAGFLALLRAAPPDAPVAFMDQDDVWAPGKLARALDRLAAGHEATCGRLALVDAALRPIGLSALPRFPPGFASLLAHNVAAGCTMALSPRGRALALAAPPPPGTQHDWWAALLVTGQGGRLDFDPQPMIRYRQHGGNAVGGGAGLRARVRRALARGRPEGLARLPAHLAALRPVPLA